MGMPVITASETTRPQAITDIVESVALQQTALSHILNAEGEKIQKAVAMEEITVSELLEINKSVESMVGTITELERMLRVKLSLFSAYFDEEDTTEEEEVIVKEEVIS